MSYSTIEELFKDKYTEYKDDYSILSASGTKCLVNSASQAYNLDKIIQAQSHCRELKSVDAVKVYNDRVVLIEFKTGFADNVTKETFESETYASMTACQLPSNAGNHCSKLEKENDTGYNNFFDLRKAQKENLMLRILSKFYETLYFFSSEVYPSCVQKRANIKIIYLVVVDSKYMKNELTTLERLENGRITTSSKNELIEHHLEKLCRIKDGQVLCDRVKVCNGSEFISIEKKDFMF